VRLSKLLIFISGLLLLAMLFYLIVDIYKTLVANQ